MDSNTVFCAEHHELISFFSNRSETIDLGPLKVPFWPCQRSIAWVLVNLAVTSLVRVVVHRDNIFLSFSF